MPLCCLTMPLCRLTMPLCRLTMLIPFFAIKNTTLLRKTLLRGLQEINYLIPSCNADIRLLFPNLPRSRAA